MKQKAMRWAADNKDKVAAADPAVPDGLNDRAADNWRILLAVADVAGGHWGDTARHFAQLVAGDRADTSELAALLHDIQDIFDERRSDRLRSTELCNELADLDHRPWGEIDRGGKMTPIRLAARLEPLGIQPKVIRVGSKTPRGYERSQFDDAFARYPRPQPATVQQGSDINVLEAERSATSSATAEPQGETVGGSVADGAENVAADVALPKGQKPSEINDVAGVAGGQGKESKDQEHAG
jgi:hypothetical protein